MSKNKYSVLLPTYNERDNLPVIINLIFNMAEKKYMINNSYIS